MALFRRPAKPFNGGKLDSDSDNDDISESKGMKRGRDPQKQESHSKSGGSKTSSEIPKPCISLQDEEDNEISEREKRQRIMEQIQLIETEVKVANAVVVIGENENGAVPVVDIQEETEEEKLNKLQARELMNTFRAIKTKASATSLMPAQAVGPRTSSTSDNYPTKKVLTAEERRRQAEKSGELLFTAHIVKSITSSNAEASASTLEELEEDDCAINVATRINGQDSRLWRMRPDQPFSKLRLKVSSLYGLTPSQFKMSFDGETLKDSQTPDELDIVDNELVDILIDKQLLKAALDNAAKQSQLSSSKNAPSAAREEEEDKADLVCIRTRMGKDERAWNVRPNGPLSKIRARLSDIYGVPTDKIVMIFDGLKVADSDTTESLSMESDDLIDIKIPTEMISAALNKAKNHT